MANSVISQWVWSSIYWRNIKCEKVQKVSQQRPSKDHHWTHFSAGDSKFEMLHSKLSLMYGHLENFVLFTNSLVYARLFETLSDFWKTFLIMYILIIASLHYSTSRHAPRVWTGRRIQRISICTLSSFEATWDIWCTGKTPLRLLNLDKLSITNVTPFQ